MIIQCILHEKHRSWPIIKTALRCGLWLLMWGHNPESYGEIREIIPKFLSNINLLFSGALRLEF